MSTPKIDASAEIEALGITHPVTFEPAMLNGPLEAMFGVDVADQANGGLTAAQTIAPGDVVKVDWDAINYSNAHPEHFKGVDPPEVSIAHEVVHVRQMQDIGYPDADKINAAYVAAGTGDYGAYRANKYEAQAFELGPKLAHLVKIEGE